MLKAVILIGGPQKGEEPGNEGRRLGWSGWWARGRGRLKAEMCFSPPGTRFRPLSFEVPKPLFPVAGVPMIQHHIEACAQVIP